MGKTMRLLSLLALLVLVAIPSLGQTTVEGGAGALLLGGKGGTLTGPLYLFEDPIQPKEAVTLEYLNAAIGGSSGGAETVTFSSTPTFSVTKLASYMVLTGNVTTFTLASGINGQSKILAFCQDGTGGHTVTAPSNVHGFMLVSTTASKCSVGQYTYFTPLSAWLSSAAPVVNQ